MHSLVALRTWFYSVLSYREDSCSTATWCNGVQVIVCILGMGLRKCVMLIEMRDLKITVVSCFLFSLLNQQPCYLVRASCDEVLKPPQQLGTEELLHLVVFWCFESKRTVFGLCAAWWSTGPERTRDRTICTVFKTLRVLIWREMTEIF